MPLSPEATVLVADDEPSVARITSRVIGTFCTALPPVLSLADLEEALRNQTPDIVILDVRFQNEASSLDLLPSLAVSYPSIRRIIYTGCPDRAPTGRSLASGALGYLSKPASALELRSAVTCVLSGRSYLSTSPIVRQQARIVSPVIPLSPCQQGVFRFLRLGLTRGAIAGRLGCSPRTVEHQSRTSAESLEDGQPEHVRWPHVVVAGPCPDEWY